MREGGGREEEAGRGEVRKGGGRWGRVGREGEVKEGDREELGKNDR